MTSTLQDQAVARGRLVELHEDKIVIGVPGTEYQLQLVSTVPSDAIATEVGKRIRGTIHARALRMHASSAGGRFIEPVWGPPRIVSGTVLGVDADQNRLLVDVSLPMWVAMHDGQQADAFTSGQMVNFYVESGTTFTPLDAS